MNAPITTARLPALLAQARHSTPLGPVTLAISATGLAGVWFDDQRHHPGPLQAAERGDHPLIAATRRALDRYCAGDGAAFDALPLDLAGTAFQNRVWQQLRRIAPGTVVSYGELAQQLDAPTASRAVGAAVGRNPLSIVVPCHRVVGSQGALTGYAGGLDRKQALLRHEATMARPAAASSLRQMGLFALPESAA